MLSKMFTIIAVLILMGPPLMTSQAEVDETSIGVIFNEVAGVRSGGLSAAAPYNLGVVDGHATVSAQFGGGIIRGKYHAEINKDIGAFGLKVYTDGLFKGYSTRDLGRQSDVGLAIEFPEFPEIGTVGLVAGAGVFGSNAGPFGPPNAGDTLEALGYDAQKLEDLELYGFTPSPTGLSFKAGNSLNLLAYLTLSHPSGASLSIRVMPELAGESDDSIHQLIISPSTSIEVRDNVNIQISADIGFQTVGDVIEKELATLAQVNFTF